MFKGGVKTRTGNNMVDQKPLTEKQRRTLVEQNRKKTNQEIDRLSDLFGKKVKINKTVPNSLINRLKVLKRRTTSVPRDIYPSTYNVKKDNKYKIKFIGKVQKIVDDKKKGISKRTSKLTMPKKKRKTASVIPDSAIHHMNVLRENRQLDTIIESMSNLSSKVPKNKLHYNRL